MADVINLFPEKKNEPYNWKKDVDNIRLIQAGFHTLDAYHKNVAFDVLADTYCAVLESIFKGEKE